MNIKHALMGSVVVGALAFSSTALASTDDKYLTPTKLAKAEKEFISLCAKDEDNTVAECTCVQKVFKEELPKKHYHIIMDIATHASVDKNGNVEIDDNELEQLFERYDAGFFTLLNFTGQIIAAAEELDACGIDSKKYEVRI